MDFFWKNTLNDFNPSGSTCIRGPQSCRSDVPSFWFLFPASKCRKKLKPRTGSSNISVLPRYVGPSWHTYFKLNFGSCIIPFLCSFVPPNGMYHHLSHRICYFLSTSPEQIVLSVLYPQCLEQYLAPSRISWEGGRKEGIQIKIP